MWNNRYFGTDRRKKKEYVPEERLSYEVGDIVKLKSPTRGSSEWEILRVGADFRLKCTGCGHQIMVARRLWKKNTKGLKEKDEDHRLI